MTNLTVKPTIKSYFENEIVKKRIEESFDKEKANNFRVSVLALANSSPLLAECEPASVFNAAMTAASLDLPINQNLGFAYIVPYNQKKGNTYVKVAQFQMGYKGFIQLAQRSGQFKTINVSDVREGEIKKMDRLTGEIKFKWLDNRLKLPVIGYVGYMELVNGFKKSMYMTIEELKEHGLRYSQNFKKYKSGLWADDFDAMAQKTVIKMLLSKYAPLTTEMQNAQLSDQAVIGEDGKVIYADNEPITADQVARQKEIDRVKAHIEKCNTTIELQSCEEAMSDLKDPELKKMYDDKYDKLQQVS